MNTHCDYDPMLPIDSGIYAITSTVSGNIYVGQSTNLRHRWRHHRKLLRAGTHFNEPLQRAWNKYGESTFSITVLLLCPDEELTHWEQHFIDTLKPAYNIAPAAGSTRGMKMSRDAVQRSAKARTGVKRGPMPEEQKEKLRRVNAHRKGVPMTEEQKARVREGVRTGKKPVISPETRERIAAQRRGKPVSEHVRERLSEVHRDKTISEQHKEAIRDYCKNRPPLSEDARKRISQSRLGSKHPLWVENPTEKQLKQREYNRKYAERKKSEKQSSAHAADQAQAEESGNHNGG